MSAPDDYVSRFDEMFGVAYRAAFAVLGERGDALPRRQRETVVLRHILDLTEADTASALGCSVGTVKSATSRGLARLRAQMSDATAIPTGTTPH